MLGLHQGDVEDDDVVGPLGRRPALGHDGPDGRVGDGVQGLQGLGIGEDQGGQGGPVEGALGGEDPGAEAVDQRLKGGSAGGHHLPGDPVGVDQDGAFLDQEISDRRLPRPDPSRQADGEHSLTASTAS